VILSIARSVLFFTISVVASSMASSADSLPIYYSSTIPANLRQEKVESEFKKMELTPVVFAKCRDFIEQVNESKPKIMIAPYSLANYYSNYTPGLIMVNQGGQKFFNYEIISLGKWKMDNMSSSRIALVEEVEKDHLTQWVTEIVGSKFKIIRTTLKPDDLFPLLIFKSVDLILISKENLKGLQEKWRTKFNIIGETKPVQSLIVYFRKDVVAKPYIEEFLKLSSATMGALESSSIVKYEEKIK
jgi:hypothetical protein